MASLELAPDNSVFVQITLSNPITGDSVDDATVTGRIDELDDTVLEPTFSMPFVSGSAGVYRATLDPVSGLVLNDVYKIVIDSTGTDSLIGHWSCEVIAKKAEGC